MEYSNEKIKKLIEERDRKVSEMDSEIEKEIQKEKAKYKFSWKRFLFLVAMVIVPAIMFKLNAMIFPKTSIWSWEHYSSGFLWLLFFVTIIAIRLFTTMLERKRN